MRSLGILASLGSLFCISLLPLVFSNNAMGQEITQTRSIDWSMGDLLPPLNFDPFPADSGNVLAEVILEFTGELTADVVIENFTADDFEADDWSIDATLTPALVSEFGHETGPVWWMGGLTETGITGRLSAGSGGDPGTNATPGDVVVEASIGDSIQTIAFARENLDYFQSDGPLQAWFEPLLGFALNAPEGTPGAQIKGRATSLRQTGELTLSYLFVPNHPQLADCNADGRVDINDLDCVCQPHGNLEEVLSANGLQVGDLDKDGTVGFADFLILSDNFGLPADEYLKGDLDCNGTVEFADFLLLSSVYGQTAVDVENVAAVPEPSCASILILGLMAALPLRRSRMR